MHQRVDPHWRETGLKRHAAPTTAHEGNRGGMTLGQIGEALGITRERVRQIETKALRKLRVAFGEELGYDEIRQLLEDK